MDEPTFNAGARFLEAAQRMDPVPDPEDFLRSGQEKADQEPDRRIVETAVEDVRRTVEARVGANTAVRAMSCGVVDNREVRAHVQAFSDGSSCVMIRTALLRLCRVYSFAVARLFKHSRSAMAQTWRMLHGATPDHYGVLAAMARVHVLNQRVHLSPGKLRLAAPRRGRDVLDQLMLSSMRFVVAHEVAHLVVEGHVDWLQHGEHRPGKEAQQLSGEFGPDAELEADQLALTIVTAILQRYAQPRARELAVLGATIAIRAMATTESCDVVRAGATHPPAGTRFARLHDDLRPRTTRVSGLITDNIRLGDAIAADLRTPIPDGYWTLLLEDPGADTTTLHSRIDEVRHADVVLCGTVDDRLDMVGRSSGRPELRKPIDSQTDLLDRLASIDVSRYDRRTLLDPREAITHTEINRILRKQLGDGLVAAAYGSVLAPHLTTTAL